MRDPSFDVTEVRMLSRNKQIEATECQHQLNTLLTLSPVLKIRQTFLREVSSILPSEKVQSSICRIGDIYTNLT